MKMVIPQNRLREIDFLRGVAIVLVLFRHTFICQYTASMGWIGVDLFFVLSGFLVSGLLFKEYLKYGDIRPGRFLIRRGFKIYPIYYLFYLVYIIPIIFKNEFNLSGVLSELTFIQNYVWGLGFANPVSWSLAVEEHFYFGFAFFVWIGLKRNFLKLSVETSKSGLSQMEIIIFIVLMLCLILRLLHNLIFPGQFVRSFTMTHLRIDSLLAGVLISYLYYFRINYLKKVIKKYRIILFIVALAGIIWTPFINMPHSFFAVTFGFSFLYISFSILLLYFLLSNDINRKLNLIFFKPFVNIISKIGYCSYSIYIIHIFVKINYMEIREKYNIPYNYSLNFILTSVISVTIGMLMTYTIEMYFLKVRDKYYPNRVNLNK